MDNGKDVNDSLSVLAKSGSIVLIGFVVSKIFSYIYRIMIARIYGPEIYGMFLIALSVIGLLSYIALMGFDSGIIRFIPLYRSQKKAKSAKFLIKFGYRTIALLGTAIGLILFIFSDMLAINLFHEPRLTLFLRIFSVLLPITALTNYFIAVINGFEQIGWSSFIENIFETVTKVIFLILLILVGISVMSVPLSYLFTEISSLILAYLIMRKRTPREIKNAPDKLKRVEIKKAKREFINFSSPLVFFSLISVLMGWIDSLSLGYFKGAAEVGIYNAAVPLSLLLYIAPKLFTKMLLPMASREYGTKNKEVINQLTKQVGKWVLLINLPLFLVLLLFPENIIGLLFGDNFTSSATALKILSAGCLVLSISRVSNTILIIVGKTKIILLSIVIAALINLVLNAILIPMPSILWIENSSGINGAALATTISSIIISGLFIFQARRYSSITPFRRKMLNLLIAGVISATATIFIFNLVGTYSYSWLIASLFLGVVYLGMILVLKCLDKNDIFIINKFKVWVKGKNKL